MRVTILAVGKIKESYLKDAISEYAKRLSKFIKLEIIEVPDEKIPDNPSSLEMDMVKNKEGAKLLSRIKNDCFTVLLAIDGKQLTSIEFSDFFEKSMTQGISHIVFVIGGSLGVSDELYSRANLLLSFSKMTFPHQVMRVILLEQIFRAYKIINHESYHK